MKKIILIILSALLFVSCAQTDSEEDKKLNKLVEMYSEAFEKRVALQYGSDAKLKNVEAEVIAHYDSVWSIPVKFVAGEDLLGEIQIGEESFLGIYYISEDEIFSKKEEKNIRESAKELFKNLGMDVVYVDIDSPEREGFLLPDTIKTIEDMFQNKYAMNINVFVTNDVSGFKRSDFNKFYVYWKNYDEDTKGYINFIQVPDEKIVDDEMIQKMKELAFGFCSENPMVYSDEKKEYVPIFEEYNIEANIYIASNYDFKEFLYQNKEGAIKEVDGEK